MRLFSKNSSGPAVICPLKFSLGVVGKESKDLGDGGVSNGLCLPYGINVRGQ